METKWIVWGAWIASGVVAALIQRAWYRRKGIKHDMAGLDFVTNGMLGPIALIGCLIAYAR